MSAPALPWPGRPRNPLSSLFAGEAFSLLTANLPAVLAHPDDLDARGCMELGAAWAGLGIAHSMLGGAHAAGNALTARSGSTARTILSARSMPTWPCARAWRLTGVIQPSANVACERGLVSALLELLEV
jgi:hypothetical protein